MQPQGTGLLGTVDQVVVGVGNNTVDLEEGGLTEPDATLEQQYLGKEITKLGVAMASARPRTTTTRK